MTEKVIWKDPGHRESKGMDGPDFVRGNCGVGFVAGLDGQPQHSVVEKGVRVLVNLEHRGAVGGDRSTGDGAGLLMQMPDAFFRCSDAGLGFRLASVAREAAEKTVNTRR